MLIVVCIRTVLVLAFCLVSEEIQLQTISIAEIVYANQMMDLNMKLLYSWRERKRCSFSYTGNKRAKTCAFFGWVGEIYDICDTSENIL